MLNIENKRPWLPLRSARHILSSLALLFVFGCIGIGPGCNLFDELGNAECSLAGDDGDGGAGGAGGGDGAGGASDQGAGGAVAASASAAATTGAGGAPGAGVGVGAGDSSDVGAGAGSGRSVPRAARTMARVPRHRPWHHKGGENIGTAVSADCTPLNVPPPNVLPPQAPNWIGLDTGTLR
jgi:hypothetical protein